MELFVVSICHRCGRKVSGINQTNHRYKDNDGIQSVMTLCAECRGCLLAPSCPGCWICGSPANGTVTADYVNAMVSNSIYVCGVKCSKVLRKILVSKTSNNRIIIYCNGCRLPQKGSLKICSRCKDARYCSEKCQRDHWPIHKTTCMNRA